MRPNITLTPRQLAVAVGAVALGGAAGTLMRDLLLRLQHSNPRTGWFAAGPLPVGPWTGQIPWVLLAINTVGAYVATRLLRGPLRQHDPNDPARLLLITGLLGGFTSYSGLFVDLANIWHRSVPGALLVGFAAIVSGIAAAALGLRGHDRS
jgi:fluoride ion exporter CrcB/FEX